MNVKMARKMILLATMGNPSEYAVITTRNLNDSWKPIGDGFFYHEGIEAIIGNPQINDAKIPNYCSVMVFVHGLSEKCPICDCGAFDCRCSVEVIFEKYLEINNLKKIIHYWLPDNEFNERG